MLLATLATLSTSGLRDVVRVRKMCCVVVVWVARGWVENAWPRHSNDFLF